MTALDKVYFRFAREHYVGRPLREPEHVEALLEAAEVPPGQVDETFWRQIEPAWLWGISPTPFSDSRRRSNAAYRRSCAQRGVTP